MDRMDAIFKASAGLPHFTRLVFYAIARRADLASGMAGIKTRISLQALLEELYVEPAPGRSCHGAQNRNSIKASLRFLCRNNYLGARGNFVFEVFCLSRDKFVQNQWTTNGPLMGHGACTDSALKTKTNGKVVSLMDHQWTANGPTSRDERNREEIRGSSNSVTSTTEGGVTVESLAALFAEKYKFPRSIANSSHSKKRFAEWVKQGATARVVEQVVDKVNHRIQAIGGLSPKYPTYYHEEVITQLNSGGHEVDQLLG